MSAAIAGVEVARDVEAGETGRVKYYAGHESTYRSLEAEGASCWDRTAYDAFTMRPFLELARPHQQVIFPSHLGLTRGALAEAGAKTRATKLEPFVRSDLCVARLAGGRAR